MAALSNSKLAFEDESVTLSQVVPGAEKKLTYAEPLTPVNPGAARMLLPVNVCDDAPLRKVMLLYASTVPQNKPK